MTACFSTAPARQSRTAYSRLRYALMRDPGDNQRRRRRLLEMRDDQRGYVIDHQLAEVARDVDFGGHAKILDARNAGHRLILGNVIAHPAIGQERRSPIAAVLQLRGRPRVKLQMY